MTDRIIGQRAVDNMLSNRRLTLADIQFPLTPKAFQTRDAAIKTLALNGWLPDQIADLLNMRVQAVESVAKMKIPESKRRMKNYD